MTNSQLITFTCETCEKITNRIKVYEYYKDDLKRIMGHSNNYCQDCYQTQVEQNKVIVKNTGEIKGFKLK
ncbi:protein of unknown function [endosymbiont DhMRE of Dentiscutata heterogama]|uniref:hypothetical protein n=1 Tax=endosymbiont DhMRE of Dentiscutata heterogama TaxID=1609546 RepID=UPI000629DC03|nr:hypothetical protein [endosymbiont DhMRE of Dentiscutata heterogama]CFW93306.1 protein of unknown function [endosymbiont DhMRE of Dentiscutata heterogama]